MTSAPTLQTKRLTLRGPEKDDLAPYTDWMVNSARLTHLGGNTTPERAWGGMISGIGHWHWHGYGFFTVVETATKTPVGRMGILNHLGWPEPELAYHMFDNGEGKGYGYESGVAARQWAGQAMGLGPLISIISPANTRSIALATRLGATPEKDTTHDGEPATLYRHLAHDDPAALAQWEAVQ
ncbi:GNAT family N-acetyltransferase [Yoonia sp. R2331]|uniref:GNAT family N-acetyltransferase n=1 Tax=Yoonia sp. R2331 TaxID=3237238 RepID=UPI0034E3930F